MTRDDQFIGLLERYLDDYEGITPLPDTVRDRLRAELPRAKQVGSRMEPKRFLSMTAQIPAPARYGLAAAAVAAAVLLGVSIVGSGGLFGDSENSPSPTASPSAGGPKSLLTTPESSDPFSGAYYLDHPAFPARIDFEVPEGWWYWSDVDATADSTAHGVLVDSSDSGAANGSAWGVVFTIADEVRVDPCNGGAMDPSVTESAAAMADAMSGWPGFPASVEDVTLGGYSGKRVEISRSEGSDCEPKPVFFTTPSGFAFGPEFSSFEPVVNQFTLLDVEGSVLVIWTTDYPGTNEFEVAGGASPDPQAHAGDQVELHEILDSIVITAR